MGRIVCLMGKSSSGKDTLFRELLKRGDFRVIVPYTTRPIRCGEKDGENYFFTDEEGFRQRMEAGQIIEHRKYATVHGLWRYFTVDDGQIRLEEPGDYLLIGTPEAYEGLCRRFGKESLLPVMITLDDGERLERALKRERAQKQPRYEEMCRRFLADSEDFSRERLEHLGIERYFSNECLEECLREILDYIREG